MNKITAIIPTYNEEANIKAAIKSVDFADEILIVDSYSKDKTIYIASESENVRVIQREYINSASQKNWAIPQAKHNWIFLLDADERVTPELKSEIIEMKSKTPKYDSYWIYRSNHFMGKKVKYSGWQNDKVIRLFKRDKCRYEIKDVHAEIITEGNIGFLKNRLWHNTFISIDDYINKLNRYAWHQAAELNSSVGYITPYHLIVKPIYRFIKHYIIQLGFLDGIIGFTIALFQSYAVSSRYVKIWILRKNKKLRKEKIKPKVLHIDTEMGYRGGQRQVTLLTNGLTEQKIPSIIVCKPNSKLEAQCKETKFPFYSVKMRNELDIFSGYKIAKICRREKLNILHAHTPHAIALCLWTKLFYRNVKIVVSRRVDFPIKSNMFSQFKYRNKFISKIICISDGIKSVMSRHINSKKLLTIRSAVDTESYNKIEYNNLKSQLGINNKIVVGTIAAFADHKDYPTLVKASKIILKNNKNIIFICCGDGETLSEVKILTKELGIYDNYIFTGFINNIHDYLGSFDIFAFPSKLEGLGTSLLDAQYHSLPIVACKTGGIPEIVKNGNNGYLCEPKDYESFAKNLLSLIKNEELRQKFGKNGSENLTNFNLKTLISKHITLYRDII